jgi:hypothetical protein
MTLGGTIAELQSRMGLKEFTIWLAYRKKFGPMNDVRRYDRPAALITSMAARLMGNNNIEIQDFLPFGKDEDQGSDLADFIKKIGGVKIGKSR